MKTLKPGSPLFTYQGAEDKNFTITKTRAGLYWFEIKSVDPPDGNLQKLTPSTVLLYATSSDLDRSVSGMVCEREGESSSCTAISATKKQTSTHDIVEQKVSLEYSVKSLEQKNLSILNKVASLHE